MLVEFLVFHFVGKLSNYIQAYLGYCVTPLNYTDFTPGYLAGMMTQ
jgi:hypothetical protein